MAIAKPVAPEGEPDVEILSPDEVRAAVQATLRTVNLTFEQLRYEAASGSFSSERARLAWAALKDIGART